MPVDFHVHILTTIPLATDVKEQIEAFKQEKIGNRRKDFVETVKTEPVGGPDGEATDGTVDEGVASTEPMDIDQ